MNLTAFRNLTSPPHANMEGVSYGNHRITASPIGEVAVVSLRKTLVHFRSSRPEIRSCVSLLCKSHMMSLISRVGSHKHRFLKLSCLLWTGIVARWGSSLAFPRLFTVSTTCTNLSCLISTKAWLSQRDSHQCTPLTPVLMAWKIKEGWDMISYCSFFLMFGLEFTMRSRYMNC